MSTLNAPALVISVVMHGIVLVGLYCWQFSTEQPKPKLVVETVFTEERQQEEFTQEMMIDTATSQNLAVTAGGTVTGQLGSAAATPMASQNIEKSDALKQPAINVTQFASVTLPGIGDVNLDLGEGEVSGEIGARVDGYGAAMHRLTHELRRLIRQEQVLVVWLFDETKSLEDDRKEISENFQKIYEELDIAREQAKNKKERFEALETLVCAFGKGLRKVTPKPTSDLKEIKQAILSIQQSLDATGEEATFASMRAVLEEFGKQARATDRKLVIITLTDEIGDDAALLEEVVDRAKLYKAPIYFLGREATFGYPYAILKWQHPEIKEWYDIPVLRGPETAMPEALQYTGFGGRWDSASSGFAPYPHARLVKESGGIFFMLQTKEEALQGYARELDRKFDDIRMKQYEPNLTPAREYVAERDKSDFRRTVWQVILRLNPHLDNELNLAWNFPIDLAGFKKEGQDDFGRGVRALQLMNVAIKELEDKRRDRDVEPDARWRAAYDLVYGQLLAFRVRVFQYLLAMDNHLKTDPKPGNPKSNHWHRDYNGKMVEPTPEQIKAAGIDTKELEEQRKKALDQYAFILSEHPGTPWAQRAEQEKTWGFGISFSDHFWDPRRDTPEIRAQIPKF